jgi:hypothetical protein
MSVAELDPLLLASTPHRDSSTPVLCERDGRSQKRTPATRARFAYSLSRLNTASGIERITHMMGRQNQGV